MLGGLPPIGFCGTSPRIIDEVKVFNYARSGEEIRAVLSARIPQLASNVPFSVGLWVKPLGPGVILTESAQPNSNATSVNAWMDVVAGGAMLWTVCGCPTIAAGWILYGAWSHLTLTYETVTLRGYFNGVSQGSVVCTRSPPSTNGVVPYYSIGMQGYTVPTGGSTVRFKGSVDQVRFYTRAIPINEAPAEAKR